MKTGHASLGQTEAWAIRSGEWEVENSNTHSPAQYTARSEGRVRTARSSGMPTKGKLVSSRLSSAAGGSAGTRASSASRALSRMTWCVSALRGRLGARRSQHLRRSQRLNISHEWLRGLARRR